MFSSQHRNRVGGKGGTVIQNKVARLYTLVADMGAAGRARDEISNVRLALKAERTSQRFVVRGHRSLLTDRRTALFKQLEQRIHLLLWSFRRLPAEPRAAR